MCESSPSGHHPQSASMDIRSSAEIHDSTQQFMLPAQLPPTCSLRAAALSAASRSRSACSITHANPLKPQYKHTHTHLQPSCNALPPTVMQRASTSKSRARSTRIALALFCIWERSSWPQYPIVNTPTHPHTQRERAQTGQGILSRDAYA